METKIIFKHRLIPQIKKEAHHRRKNCVKCTRLLSLVILTLFGASACAQTLPQFHIVKPSTTGVPGEEVRVMKFDPAGNLWIAGRFYFWEKVGLAMLSADQLDHQPLPGSTPRRQLKSRCGSLTRRPTRR